MKYMLCVITGLPQIDVDDPESYGGVYDADIVKTDHATFVGCNELGIAVQSESVAKIPAFSLGEVFLVLTTDSGGFPITAGSSVHPGKFDVEFELYEMDQYEKAAKRAAQVVREYDRKCAGLSDWHPNAPVHPLKRIVSKIHKKGFTILFTGDPVP